MNRLARGTGVTRGWWWWGVPTALAGFTTFCCIGRQSLWLDEACSVRFATEPWSKMLMHLRSGEAHMGLYYLLLRFWMELGDSEAFLRSLSAIFAVLSIPVVFSIARRLSGRPAAFVAAVVLAGNWFFIHCGQEARSYAPALFMTAASVLLLLRAVEFSSRRRWAAWMLGAALSVWFHPFTALVLLAQGVAVMLFPPRPGVRRSLLLGAGGVLVLIAPLLLLLIGEDHGNLDWVERPGPGALLGYFEHLAGSPPLLLAHALALLALLLTLVLAPGRIAGGAFPFALLIGWLLLPVLCGYAVSQVRPVFNDRYFCFSLPALTILTGVAVSGLRPRVLRVVALLVLVGLSVPPALGWYRNLRRENWRGATEYVLAEAREGDRIGFSGDLVELPYDYYLSRSGLPDGRPVKVSPGADPESSRGGRIWLVLSHHLTRNDEPTRECRAILARLSGEGRLLRQIRFLGVTLQLYEL